MSDATVLVVDDDPEIVRLLRSYLERSGYSVLTAGTGAAALAALRTARPDVLLLDLMLPDLDGWAITREVRRDPVLAETQIIMLTARVEDSDKILGLELGADDYMTKPFNPREVVARVKARLRRQQEGALPQILAAGALRLDRGRHEVRVANRPVELTPTEFSLLELLLENPGHTFSRAELISRALGYGFEGYERTLDSHIKNLRRKIETDPRAPQYVETVYGVGYRLRPPEQSGQ